MTTAQPGRRAPNRQQSAYERVQQLAGKIAKAESTDLHAFVPRATAKKQAVVAVIGEVNQGKSSIINALIGRPGLSPVDYRVHTDTYLLFAHDDDERVRAHFGDHGAAAIGVDDLAVWASSRVPQAVQHLDVKVRAPWLGGLVLVDTPGSGGLNSRHGKVALAAIEQASALLFVSDADSPFSESELRFITEAAQRIETVLFVLTKTGNTPGWREVLEENENSVAKVAPRFASAPWIPVDSVLATRSLTLLDGRHPLDVAQFQHVSAESVDGAQLDHVDAREDDTDTVEALELWEESGIKQLLDVLRTDVEPRGAELAGLNVLRYCRSLLDRLERIVATEIASFDDDPALQAAVELEQARLAKLHNEQRLWSSDFDRRVSLLRIDVTQTLGARTTATRSAWTDRVLKITGGLDEQRTEALLLELRDDLDNLSKQVLTNIDARFISIASALFAELDGVDIPDLQSLPELVDLALPQLLSAGRFGRQEALDAVLTASSSSRAATGLVGVIGHVFNFTTNPVLAIAGAIGGAGGVGFRLWTKRDASRKAELRQTIASWITEAQSIIRNEIERRVVERRFDVAGVFRASLEQQIADVDRLLQATKLSAKTAAGDRESTRKDLRQKGEEIGRARREIDQLLARPAHSCAPSQSNVPGGTGGR